MEPLIVDTSYETERRNAEARRYSPSFWSRSYERCANICFAITAFTFRLRSRIAQWIRALPPIVWFAATFPGWQAGVVIAVAIATFVLMINLTFLIVATRRHWGSNGMGTLIEGDCAKLVFWNKVAHAFINVMSTFLLMQSNYCMQLLASPTRADVDTAHAKRRWVDIGLQSFRNVWQRHISPWRSLFWVVLAISSVPLHLLWNSAIIFSPSAFTYYQLTVTEGFVRGSPFYYTGYVKLGEGGTSGYNYPDNLYFLQQELAGWKNLTSLQCRRAYAQDFIRDRSDVIVVIADPTPGPNSTRVLGATSGGSGSLPYSWLCPIDTTGSGFKCYDRIRVATDVWRFPKYNNPEVKYCLSKEIEPRCKLQYGFYITLLTVIANAFKVFCFLATLRIMKKDTQNAKAHEGKARNEARLLITTGDAVASFLEYPDRETFGMSIVEKEDFENGIWALRWVPINPILWRWRGACSWFRGVGLRQWMIGLVPIAVLVFVPSIFMFRKLDWFIRSIGLTRATIKRLGIGNPSGLFLLGRTSPTDQYQGWRLLSKVAQGNSPQLVISIAAYLWNNQLTAMVAAREYDEYAAPLRGEKGEFKPSSKRGLRVTNPQKDTEQHSTRFLSIPFRYWITNVVLWTVLHYLASQSLFFARVDILDHWETITTSSISQVGYSVLGLIYFIVCAFVALVYIMWISLRRLPNRMPLAATCSGALSAACHPKDRRVKHHEMRVHWGVEPDNIDEDDEGEDHEKKILRCTFTSGEAYYPDAGRYYA